MNRSRSNATRPGHARKICMHLQIICMQKSACRNLHAEICMQKSACRNLHAEICMQKSACRNLHAEICMQKSACRNLHAENLHAEICMQKSACRNLHADSASNTPASCILPRRYMHTATHYYLFNLAVSDLLVLLLGLPFETYLIWSHYPWPFGHTFCALRVIAAEASTNASILTITGMCKGSSIYSPLPVCVRGRPYITITGMCKGSSIYSPLPVCVRGRPYYHYRYV